MREMISLGVPAGTMTPFHELASTPGAPASAVVGISGNNADLFAFATANAFSRCDFKCGRAGGIVVAMNWTLPARRSVNAGEAPLYGT